MTITVHNTVKYNTVLLGTLEPGQAFIDPDSNDIGVMIAAYAHDYDVEVYSLTDSTPREMRCDRPVSPVDLHVYVGDEPSTGTLPSSPMHEQVVRERDAARADRDGEHARYCELRKALSMAANSTHDDVLHTIAELRKAPTPKYWGDKLKVERAKNRKLRKELRDG